MKLIDIFTNENRLYVWLKNKENLFFECEFNPTFYLLCKKKQMNGISKILTQKNINNSFEIKKTLNGMKKVLSITVPITEFFKTTNFVDKLLEYNCELYNSDIPLEEYYFAITGIFPNCEVDVEIKDGKIVKISTRETPFNTYQLPDLKIMNIEVETKSSLLQNNIPNLKLIRVGVNEFNDFSSFIDFFEKENPDLIICDNRELRYLLLKCRESNPEFNFSRIGKDDFKEGGDSYMTYGRTIHKSYPTYLKGRLHMQPKGVLYGSWNIEMPLELSRICRVPLQKINHRSVGYGVSALQLQHALKKEFLIPRRSSCVERWKTGYELFNADRGSLIYEPIIGYHDDIAEIDFISLFPSIMVNKNLSTETLFCKCCPDNKVPGLQMNVCVREKGIMAEVLEPLIAQRQKYKEGGYGYRADALKGILVTSFGYMGFRKSRFARIETHQAIQAYAREILLEASKISEELGFLVIHGITDSLWIKKKDITRTDVELLIKEIKARTGFLAKCEGLYRWIVFLPSTMNKNIPVSTRYYGVFENGEIKCRGIELRRHDTPPMIKEFQEKLIKKLSEAKNEAEFRTKLSEGEKDLNIAVSNLVRGLVSAEELTITKGISKTDYNSNLAQAVIIRKLKLKGFNPQPGQYIHYIIRDRKSPFPHNRYDIPGEELKYDRGEYIRIMKDSVNCLFPFVEHQMTLNDYTRTPTKKLQIQIKQRPI